MFQRRPQTAVSRTNESQSQMSDLMTISSDMKILQNQTDCQWNNKVNTQVKGLTRYKIDYQKKMGQLKDLPKIEMSLYDDQRCKQFLQNNFMTVNKKDFISPPQDLRPNKPYKPQSSKEMEYVDHNSTRYQYDFKKYNLRDDQQLNKPMPNNIQITKQNLNGKSHYQSTFSMKELNKTNSCKSSLQSRIPITSNIPFSSHTEQKSQYQKVNVKKQGLIQSSDNLFGSLSFKGQYLTENQKQYQNKLRRHRKG